MPSYGSCCVVPGCSMRANTNPFSKIRTHVFPKDPNRRVLWIAAVKRENWTPSKYSSICSNHFITGRPSSDPSHPDWVPSKFTFRAKLNQAQQTQTLARYERLRKRIKPSSKLPISVQRTDTEAQLSVSDNQNSLAYTVHEAQEIEFTHMECRFKDCAVQTICDGSKLTDSAVQTEEAGNSYQKQAINAILYSEQQLTFYTGIVNAQVFNPLLAFFTSFWTPSYAKTKMEASEQLLLVLMRLRLGLGIQDLAYRFGVSSSTVTNIFHDWLDVMSTSMSSLIRWPSRKAVKQNLPAAFKDPLFANVVGIIDCTEIFIDKPSSLQARAQTYSRYKNHNTIKILVVIAPSGGVTFISKAWGGRVSDKQLVKECGLMNLVREGDVYLVDRGFQCSELFAAKGAKLLIPASTKGKEQLSGKDVTLSRKMSRVRIHVERAIRRIKTYKLLFGTMSLLSIKKKSDTKVASVDKILTVVSALVNLLPPLIDEHDNL